MSDAHRIDGALDDRLTIFARFHARAGCESAAEEAVLRVIRMTHEEPGCLCVAAYRSTRDARTFFIHSQWTNEAAFELHAGLPHTVQFIECVEKLIDHPLDISRARTIGDLPARRCLPALVIIDMQKGMQLPAAGTRNNPEAEGNIAKLLGAWRRVGAPVVHVRHVSREPASLFRPGQPGIEFQAGLAPLDGEYVVEKNVPDAFTHSGLERWLRSRAIDAVAIAGVSTNNSVESTARTAGNLGFDTTVVSDATFAFAKIDFNGASRSAGDVHAMALANLQGEYATIVDTMHLLRAIEPESDS
jgi:nicotinamidase-related amidase/quinol monooxygenase YgiN